MNFVTWFEPAIPIAMPTPNATTTTPQPAAFAWSVVFTKIGPERQHRAHRGERDHDPGGHGRRDRVLAEETQPVARCRARCARGRSARALDRRAPSDRHAAHHHRRERERPGVQQEREGLRPGEADSRC